MWKSLVLFFGFGVSLQIWAIPTGNGQSACLKAIKGFKFGTQENLQKFFIKGKTKAYANGLLLRVRNYKDGRLKTILILSDYVGSAHRDLLKRIKDSHHIEEILWGGEVEMTQKDGTQRITAANNSSGLINAAVEAMDPEVANLKQDFAELKKFLAQHKNLVDPDVDYKPFRKDEQHLMKVEGVDDFDPKHADAAIMVDSANNIFETEKDLPRSINALQQENIFAFYEGVISNFRTNDLNPQLKEAINKFRIFKKEFEAYNPANPSEFLKTKGNWVAFSGSAWFLIQYAREHPKAQRLIFIEGMPEP